MITQAIGFFVTVSFALAIEKLAIVPPCAECNG
jgi:hypothetical protein